MRLRALTLAMVAASALADPATYRVDNENTRAEFEIAHFGVIHTQGRFERLAGRLAFDGAARAGSIVLDIAAASVATGWDARDEFIRGESMFAAARYPRVHFQSTRFEFAGDRLARVAGDLTLRGVRRPIVLAVGRIECGGTACVAEVSGNIRRSEFGMEAMWPVLSDDVALSFRIHAVKE